MAQKIKLFFPLFAFLFFSIFASCYATSQALASDSNFDIAVDSSYTIHKDGITTVAQKISITNKTEFYYTPSYTVSVGFKDIEKIQAYNGDGIIPTTLDDKNPDNKSIKLTFQKRYTGISNKNTFTLQFDTRDIAVKQGSIWEVTIPGIDSPSDFTKYDSTITVPDSFGKASIVKPQKKLGDGGKIILTKEDIGRFGVYILFGGKQYYAFTLKYNISNPNLFPVRTEIALPPQTNYQNVSVSTFSKSPLGVKKDKDGNWIAEYRLLPQEKEQIIVTGTVEVLADPSREELTNQQIMDYTSGRKYWDTTDPAVLKVAKDLKTPKDIYDYVVKTLSYNYSKIATDNLRLGGKGALADPKNSVCLEFTDLFVSLARAKGIPARSVEGFAYTQNSKLRPLSLVNDILHAWPEYYDQNRHEWIMVDPTWGNTTKGMDYFSSLDFQHVAFAIKGSDSEYPIPAGGYKFDKDSKDVDVHFADESQFRPIQKIEITDTFPTFSFPKLNLHGTFDVKNAGTVPMANVTANLTTSRGSKRQYVIDYIPPGGKETITASFSDVPFLTNSTYVITIHVGKTSYSKKVRISFVPDLQLLLFIGGIIGGSTIIAAITFRTGSILILRRKRKNSLRR